MIVEEIINGNIFIAQTTFRLYANEEELQKNHASAIMSDEKEFEELKERIRKGPPITKKGFKL